MNAAKTPPGLSMTCLVFLVALSCLATSAQTAPPAGGAASTPNPSGSANWHQYEWRPNIHGAVFLAEVI